MSAKKKGDCILMMPGSEGWELWSGSSTNGFTRIYESDERYALEVEKVPSGLLNFALPVRQMVSLPFKAQTDDLSLLGDLATMHLERHGVRPSLDGGELADYFVYSTEGEDSVLTPVVLTPPEEGELPRKSPNAFDVSPRCLPLPTGKVVVWRELGRWVFALGDGERLLYFQCLPGEILDERSGRDVRLALSQLNFQGVLPEVPDQFILWTTGGVGDPRQEHIEAFIRGANASVEQAAKPDPHWPTPPSRLLPADVRAERMQLKAKRSRNLMIALACIAYIGLIGFLYQKYREAENGANIVEKKIKNLGSETQDLLAHQSKWDELAPVVESDFYPYEVFHRITSVAPRGGGLPLRLVQATIVNQFRDKDGESQVFREVTLRGNAAETKNIAEFNLNLKNSEELQEFEWITPPEQKTKAGRWGFVYTATAL